MPDPIDAFVDALLEASLLIDHFESEARGADLHELLHAVLAPLAPHGDLDVAIAAELLRDAAGAIDAALRPARG